jgi:hypothetical protein
LSEKLVERLQEKMTRRGFFGLGVAGISAALLLGSTAGCAGEEDDDEGEEEED